MASYQIPQFLDSGDKILGPLSIRQFGYALGGFMTSAFIFTVLQSFAPGIGSYAIIPCLPIAGLALYLALGKYNGRDSEIYVLRYIIYNSKPKIMVYTRVPEISDLREREAQYTSENIIKRWTADVNQKKAIEGNSYLTFNQTDSMQKAKKIRQLGDTIDVSLTNTLSEVRARQMEIEQKEALLKQAEIAAARARQNGK